MDDKAVLVSLVTLIVVIFAWLFNFRPLRRRYAFPVVLACGICVIVVVIITVRVVTGIAGRHPVTPGPQPGDPGRGSGNQRRLIRRRSGHNRKHSRYMFPERPIPFPNNQRRQPDAEVVTTGSTAVICSQKPTPFPNDRRKLIRRRSGHNRKHSRYMFPERPIPFPNNQRRLIRRRSGHNRKHSRYMFPGKTYPITKEPQNKVTPSYVPGEHSLSLSSSS